MKYINIILILIIGCKSVSSTTNQQSIPPSSQTVFEEIDRIITDNSVTIKFKNITDQEIEILNPMEKKIEIWQEGQWNKIGVLYCDCGGPPCPAPPEVRLVEPKGGFVFSWDRNEEKCLATDSVKVTEKKKVEAGEYRALYSYRLPDGSVEEVDVRFTLD
ncbi:hypothetical protein [Ekhidna sp.]|uniref:hypothetical protein n=1 Tax=Ekhidna sp. TaxID=2608089 RepID=UPI0035149AC8